MSGRQSIYSWIAGISAGLVTSAASYAQAPAAAPASGQRLDTLTEVVITAERRVEQLNQMAVAGEAFSTAEIEKRSINEIEDLVGQTPSLSIKDSGVNRFVTIRGVGLNATTATITSGVAIHVDGIGLWGAGIALGNPFYDLERIEVLRGPQGTFVGQNSTGGAMFIVSKSPKLGQTDFSVEQTLGSYAWTDTVAAGGLALTEHTAARIAVRAQRRDSFWANAGTLDPMFGFVTTDPKQTHQDEPGNLQEQAVRLKYLWQPSDALSFEIMHERYKKHTDGTPQTPLYQFAGNVGTAPPAVRAQYAAEIKANTDPYLLAYNSPSRFDIDLDRTSLEVNWQITPGISLRSLTAVQHFTQARLIDTDGTVHANMQRWQAQGGAIAATPYMGRTGSPLTETGGWQDTQIGPNRTRTQEFNLLSTTDSPWRWSLGLFWSDQKAQQNQYNSILENGASRQQTQILNNRNTQSNAAAFGQVTWRASEQFEVIAGLRYNRDEAENPGGLSTIYRPNPQTANQPPAAVNVLPAQTIVSTSVGESSGNATTGKLALNWHINADQILYGIVAKGYKAGNFNNQNPLATTNPPESFKPESVMSYEVGWKATMLDNHLHSDLTAFQTDYEDYQLNFLDPVANATYVTNLPKARIKGIEWQLRAQFGGFGANVAAASLSSEVVDIGSLNLRDGRRPGVPTDLVGKELPFAPPYTVSVGVDYAIPIGDSGTLTPRVQYAASGEQWATVFQIPSLAAGSITNATPAGTPDGGTSPDFLPSYSTLDASLTWAPNQTWMIQAFGTNLTDEVYIAGHTGDFIVYSAPMQYGVRFRYAH